ncbi:MAG: PspC domain-containing protein [Sphingomonadaceae bacterium]|nr:MAG: PspC domain-containing protein [Sphingomonadaceae bacterium]
MRGHSHGTGLYKDSENGWLMGVCAGIANYFDFSRNGVRLIAVFFALFMFWPTVVAYAVAGMVLRDRPLYYRGRDERRFWRQNSRHQEG